MILLLVSLIKLKNCQNECNWWNHEKFLASTYITFCGYFNMKAAKMRIMTPESVLLVIWPPHKPPPLQFFIFYYLLVIKFNSFLLLKFGWTQVDHKIFFIEMRISFIVRSNVFKDIYHYWVLFMEHSATNNNTHKHKHNNNKNQN